MNTMKAIFIDTVNRQVREVEIPRKGLEKVYELIGEGCGLVEIAARDGNDVVFVDEEGLFNSKVGCFTFDDSHPFHGSAVVCGGNDEGDSADVKLNVDEVRKRVRFGILVPRS
jgi:hypothetical protein